MRDLEYKEMSSTCMHAKQTPVLHVGLRVGRSLIYLVPHWSFIFRSCWWRGTVVERRSLAGELSRPALDLHLTRDQLYGLIVCCRSAN